MTEDQRRTAPHTIGSVIVPAHNEASVILRTLQPLAAMVANGELELVVAANGCTDETVTLAQSFEGVTVLDLPTASKTGALNAAEATATTWPRMYLDADIEVTVEAVRRTFEVLKHGGLLAARPAMGYATQGSSFPVRSYYRARLRLDEVHDHLWGAGCYALNRIGRERFGQFPTVTNDDYFVDILFDSHEKGIVRTQPVLVQAPHALSDLRGVLRRVYRGNRELPSVDPLTGKSRSTTPKVASELVRSIRGPLSLVDAVVYAAVVLWCRMENPRRSTSWERDDSSRFVTN